CRPSETGAAASDRPRPTRARGRRAAPRALRLASRGCASGAESVSQRPSVEILWMSRVNPVDEATTKFFFDAALREIPASRDVHALSYAASLDHSRARHRISVARDPKKIFRRHQ